MELKLQPLLNSEITILQALELSTALRAASLNKVKKVRETLARYIKVKKSSYAHKLEEVFHTSMQKIKSEVLNEIMNINKHAQIQIEKKSKEYALKILTEYSKDNPQIILDRIETLKDRVGFKDESVVFINPEILSLLTPPPSLQNKIFPSNELEIGEVKIKTSKGCVSVKFSEEISYAA